MPDFVVVVLTLVLVGCTLAARRHVDRAARVLRQARPERPQDGPKRAGDR